MREHEGHQTNAERAVCLWAVITQRGVSRGAHVLREARAFVSAAGEGSMLLAGGRGVHYTRKGCSLQVWCASFSKKL